MLEQRMNTTAVQGFGRYLIRLDRQQLCDLMLHDCAQIQHLSASTYYLKWQSLRQSAAHVHSFEQEISYYSKFQQQAEGSGQGIVLPFAILNTAHVMTATMAVESTEDLVSKVLCVQAAEGLFAQTPDQLSDDACMHRLFQSLNVLEQLHHKGYVHGDLKIQHFRCWEGRAYLIDFEQCQVLGQAAEAVHSSTPRYMAPELFHAQPKSTRTDIYALGVIWHMWLSQRRPMLKTYQDWAVWHCQQFDIALPSRFSQLSLVLQQMLRKNKADRYANICEIKQRLIKLL